jgi:hypothetical protein
MASRGAFVGVVDSMKRLVDFTLLRDNQLSSPRKWLFYLIFYGIVEIMIY